MGIGGTYTMTNTQLTSNSKWKKLKDQEQDRNVHFHHSWATWYQQQQSNRKKKQRHSRNREPKWSIGRHTAPPHTTRIDRKLNGKEVRHQGDKQ